MKCKLCGRPTSERDGFCWDRVKCWARWDRQNTCRHCGGNLLFVEDGQRTCLLCNRPHSLDGQLLNPVLVGKKKDRG